MEQFRRLRLRPPWEGLPFIGELPVQSDADLLLDLWKDEADAIRKYREYAEITKDPNLRVLFRHIAGEEEHHKEELGAEIEKEKNWRRRY